MSTKAGLQNELSGLLMALLSEHWKQIRRNSILTIMRAVQLKAERYGIMAFYRNSRRRSAYSSLSTYGARRNAGGYRGRGRGRMYGRNRSTEAAFQRGIKAGMRKRRSNGRRSYTYR